jgi:radical SAM superfamily enzyme YgiQ (UPF0313 family)
MRLRPVEEVVEEIERRRLRRFFLTDDNFGLAFRTNPDYIEAILKALANLPLQGWTTQAELLISEYPDLLALARRAGLDKVFIGFESVNPANRGELGGKSKGLTAQYMQAVKRIHAHEISVVGLFVFGFDHDTPDTLTETWEFARASGLDSLSMTILTPYPGTPFRAQMIAENRLMDKPWRYYDTAHLTYRPKTMSVDELERAHDAFCRRAYNTFNIARRGLRVLSRHSPTRLPRKLFGSFSTDIGYRHTFAWRHVQRNRLLNAWGLGE